ncbi:MAG: sulfite exporter TauE/SafE family protein [Alphaproteobacteria bacterium]
MDITVSFGELALLAGSLMAAGVVAGLLAGLFGIGGGGIIVPVMVEVLDALHFDPAIQVHVGVGTALAVVVPTSIRSTLAHLKSGKVDTGLLRSWIVPVPLGVAAAALVAAFVSGDVLRLIFAGIASTIGIRLLLNLDKLRLGPDIPGEPLRAVSGALIGFVSALMGIGGGVINNTYMTLFNRPIHQAVATSAGVGVLIAIPGAIGYAVAGWSVEGLPPFSVGYVNLLAVALVIPITILLAPIGARMAHRWSKRKLQIGFGLFLLAISTRLVLAMLG